MKKLLLTALSCQDERSFRRTHLNVVALENRQVLSTIIVLATPA